VLRYEVRLNSKKQIAGAMASCNLIGSLSLHDLFSMSFSRQVLQHHWQKLYGKVTLSQLDSDKPEQILANILLDPNRKGPRDALAQFGMSILLESSDPRLTRKLLEDRFGKHVWNRLKSLRAPPGKQNYRAFLHIEESLKAFLPTHLAQI
jgi:hypothetical protein